MGQLFDDSQLEPCRAPRWAQTGHRQTILGHLLPSPALGNTGRRLEIPVTDGDQLIASGFAGTSPFVVLIFHGLGGSTDSDYMSRTAQISIRQSHTTILVNHRGCGSGRGFARKPYHSGRGDDISAVVDWARKTWPTKKIITVGFSLSANAILTLLTGIVGEHQPDFAIAVNGPIDLKTSSLMLHKGWNRIYDFRFVQMCRDDIYFRKQKGLIEFDQKIPLLSYLADIDRLYTAPHGGFESADHYYASRSTANHLAKIKTPTVLIMSKDDPFIPYQSYESANANPNVQLRLEDVGGHMGYLSRKGVRGLGYTRWLDSALETYLKEITQ